MITDVLFKRYPERWIHSDGVPEPFALLVRQAALVLFDDIAPKMPNVARLWNGPEKRLAREFGAMALGQAGTPDQRIMNFLGEPYNLWNDAHRDPDSFFKLRLSLLELLFREAESMVATYAPRQDVASWWALIQKRTAPAKNVTEHALYATMTGIAELNSRLKDAGLAFEYHNGLIQRVDDPFIAHEIEHPFWALVADPRFANVDADIKEAMDRRDAGKPDAAFHALRALESAVKILSDELGLTRGTEGGAAEYIDNLVSAKNGRFVDPWEAEHLKLLFRSLRNPLGHGAGSSTAMQLSDVQSTWAIEQAMSWVKSLLRRKP